MKLVSDEIVTASHFYNNSTSTLIPVNNACTNQNLKKLKQ